MLSSYFTGCKTVIFLSVPCPTDSILQAAFDFVLKMEDNVAPGGHVNGALHPEPPVWHGVMHGFFSGAERVIVEIHQGELEV